MADAQASFIKLSLEKYAGIVSVLSQGGDAAALVSDVSSLKEVTSSQPRPRTLAKYKAQPIDTFVPF